MGNEPRLAILKRHEIVLSRLGKERVDRIVVDSASGLLHPLARHLAGGHLVTKHRFCGLLDADSPEAVLSGRLWRPKPSPANRGISRIRQLQEDPGHTKHSIPAPGMNTEPSCSGIPESRKQRRQVPIRLPAAVHHRYGTDYRCWATTRILRVSGGGDRRKVPRNIVRCTSPSTHKKFFGSGRYGSLIVPEGTDCRNLCSGSPFRQRFCHGAPAYRSER